MSSSTNKIISLLSQMRVQEMHTLRSHAEIVSGGYKLNRPTKRVLGFNGEGKSEMIDVPFTNDELLTVKLSEMDSHIRRMDVLCTDLVMLAEEKEK